MGHLSENVFLITDPPWGVHKGLIIHKFEAIFVTSRVTGDLIWCPSYDVTWSIWNKVVIEEEKNKNTITIFHTKYASICFFLDFIISLQWIDFSHLPIFLKGFSDTGITLKIYVKPNVD